MKYRYFRQYQTGQALVEYALILALVAVVVILAAFLLGLATQRVTGVVGGALGVKHDTTGTHQIVIESAECMAQPSTHLTGLVVYGTTDEDVTTLTGSTEQAVGTGLYGDPRPVTSNEGVARTFLFNPLLSEAKADLTLCPKSIVIQAKDGSIAVSPVTARVIP